VLVTEMEHHSNLVPWQMACQRSGARLRYLEVDDEGQLSLEGLDAELSRGDVRVLAFAHVSNVLGTINPVADMVARARAAGVVTVVDGCQAVPQLPVALDTLGADFYVWTGHKALGPTGIGVLHGRPERLEEMEPWLGGGHMISRVQRESSTWAEVPAKFEAGTANIAEAVGLGAAVEYLRSIGMQRVREHEQALTAYTLDGLASLPGVRVVGPPRPEQRGGVIGFALEGIHPHDVADLLNRDNVCVRAGHHCAQPLMARLGVSATARASFGPYNVMADADALIASLARARSVFGD
jgi:cysteine desulfurase/selenocysteine lyase